MSPPRSPAINRRPSTTPIGFMPSKRRTTVKSVQDMHTVSELRDARKQIVQSLRICDPALKPKLELRLEQVEARLSHFSSVNLVTSDLSHVRIDDVAGPSSLNTSSPFSNEQSMNGTHLPTTLLTHSPHSPTFKGPPSPVSSYPLMSTAKARILAKAEQVPLGANSRHKPAKVQVMNTEDTVRMERLEYAKALERQQRLQADRQARDELRSQATAEGLSEQERRRRILAFMNYKGESDEDEDNEEAEDDDSYEYGNYGVISYQNQGRPDLDYFENEDALADDGDGMDLDQLSNLIKVDTKNAC